MINNGWLLINIMEINGIDDELMMVIHSWLVDSFNPSDWQWSNYLIHPSWKLDHCQSDQWPSKSAWFDECLTSSYGCWRSNSVHYWPTIDPLLTHYWATIFDPLLTHHWPIGFIIHPYWWLTGFMILLGSLCLLTWWLFITNRITINGYWPIDPWPAIASTCGSAPRHAGSGTWRSRYILLQGAAIVEGVGHVRCTHWRSFWWPSNRWYIYK